MYPCYENVWAILHWLFPWREFSNSLSYDEVQVRILDRQVPRLQIKEVSLVKVLWRNQKFKKATLEAEEDIKSKYPFLFMIPKIHA